MFILPLDPQKPKNLVLCTECLPTPGLEELTETKKSEMTCPRLQSESDTQVSDPGRLGVETMFLSTILHCFYEPRTRCH